MKKEKFKGNVVKQVKNAAKKYLISLRGSKSCKLMHTSSMKDYLTSKKLTLQQKKLLFALKTRCVDVKTNFKKKFSNSNMFCRLCKDESEEESEMHLLKCTEIIDENCLKNLNTDIAY